MSKSKRRNRSRHSDQRRHAPSAGSARPPSENLVGPGNPDDRTQAIGVTEVMMAHRHKATGRAPEPPDDPANVRIAVITAPGPEVSLRKEIRLCRAALLYGDAVTLYSPNALMLASVERLGNATGDERVELLRALYPIVKPDAGPAVLEALDKLMGLRKRRRRTREQLQLVLRLEQMLKHEWHGIEETAAQMLDQAGAHELIPAMRSGLLELHPLVEADSDMSTDSIVGGLVARAGEILANGATYPLLDDALGDLVRAALSEGLFEVLPRAGVHARQAGAAAGFFEMLPSFPLAHIDEVLDIRKELEGPLTRFRGALAELTTSMEAAAHDEAFAGELRDLWVTTVEPALQEIRDLIDQHSFLRELIGQITSARDMAATGIALAAAKEIHAPDILAFGTAVALPTVRAAWERDKARRAVQGHQFYFLHGVQQRLEH
jgi:hypothetical protein